MKLIKPYYEILSKINRDEILKNIEIAGRTCYKSEDKITDDSAAKFVKMIIASGHESVLEHEKISVRLIVDRGVSHEIVRHRLASFSQESTRYCNYGKDKYEQEITFIIPEWFKTLNQPRYMLKPDQILKFKMQNVDELEWKWVETMAVAEKNYMYAIDNGWTAQQARSLLPNSLKTEIVVTANMREWRLIFKLRTSHKAHPQMREIMCPLLDELSSLLPEIFGDIKVEKITVPPKEEEPKKVEDLSEKEKTAISHIRNVIKKQDLFNELKELNRQYESTGEVDVDRQFEILKEIWAYTPYIDWFNMMSLVKTYDHEYIRIFSLMDYGRKRGYHPDISHIDYLQYRLKYASPDEFFKLFEELFVTGDIPETKEEKNRIEVEKEKRRQVHESYESHIKNKWRFLVNDLIDDDTIDDKIEILDDELFRLKGDSELKADVEKLRADLLDFSENFRTETLCDGNNGN